MSICVSFVAVLSSQPVSNLLSSVSSVTLSNSSTPASTPPRAAVQDVEIANLKVNTKYRVSVGAYGWAGEGRPSMPRDVSTASHGTSISVANAVVLAMLLITGHTFGSACAIRDVHAPVAPHPARCHGRVRHRAGIVMAARRERGKRPRAALLGGLYKVSLN